MIDDIQPVTKTIEFKGQTYEVPPVDYGIRQPAQELARQKGINLEDAFLEVVLSKIDGIGFDPEEDKIDDVGLGFIKKVQDAFSEGNGIEDFPSAQQHPTLQQEE
jgi:hypothetical protein